MKAVREEEVKLRWVGFVRQVGFKPAMKDKGSDGCAEWWIRRGRSDGWRNWWVGNGGTGTRIRLTKT